MRPRSKLLRPFLAAALVATGVGVSGAPATGEHVPDELLLVDAAVTLESLPETVDPPGSHFISRVVVDNEGTLAITVTVKDTLPAGFEVIDVPVGCSASGLVVTCANVALGGDGTATDTKTFDIVAKSAPTTGDYDITAEVKVDSPLEPLDQHPGNNSQTTTTKVRDGEGTFAFVPGGQSATFEGHVVTIPATDSQGNDVKGVMLELTKAEGEDITTCPDNGTCEDGIAIVFGSEDEFPEYQVTDPAKPVRADLGFVFPKPCNGLGNPSCHPIYYALDVKADTAEKVKQCAGAGSGDQPGSGVLDKSETKPLCRDQVYKNSGLVRSIILLLSIDPKLGPISV